MPRQRSIRERALSAARSAWIRSNSSPSRLAYRIAGRHGRRVVVCLGDSHLGPLRRVQRRGSLPHTTLKIVTVEGATASGVANPNSRTQALPVYEAALEHAPAGCAVLVCLGEVDVGFLSFLRAQGDPGTTVRDYTDEAIARYTRFVETHVMDRGFQPLLLSATYPTVERYDSWTGLGGARRQVTASQEERARETRHFNASLETWCAAVGARWLDLTPASVDGLTVRPEFVNPDPENHHYAPAPYADLVEQLLREHLAETAAR